MKEFTIHPMQSAWLTLESQATPMHVGGLLYFQPPSRAGADFVQQLARRLRAHGEAVEPWNCRLRRGHGLLARAKLEPVDELDIDYHFRHSALPAPGGERQMGELVSRLHAHPMDLGKPLWEVHLIEGLQGGRFALYIKLHAVLLDAPTILQALKVMLGTLADDDEIRPLWQQALPRRRAAENSQAPWPALLRSLGQRLGGDAFRRGDGQPVPRSALNDRVSGQRRFATQQYPVERLRPLAAALGASEEELLYYLCASALRRFFREFNALPERSLIALVADRGRRDDRLSPLFIPLATHKANKGQRLEDIQRSLRMARQQFAMLRTADAQAEAILDTLPYLLRQALGVDHQLPPMFNVGIAQLSLGDEVRYLGGAKLEAIFPMPMLLQGGALNLVFMRYAQTWNVGLCGARENLPHLQRMAVYMGLALEELEALQEALSHE